MNKEGLKGQQFKMEHLWWNLVGPLGFYRFVYVTYSWSFEAWAFLQTKVKGRKNNENWGDMKIAK